MSCAPRESCTECHVEWRSSDVRHFSMCQHRICKTCLASRDGASTTSRTRRGSAIAREICPVCDENRRCLSVQVRTGIWSEQLAKYVCVECGFHGPGTLMKCGHSYCAPCLRKQPRSAQSRDIDGSMAKKCRDCAEKAAEEFRDATRAAMRRSESEARIVREERETRDFRRSSQLLKQQQQQQPQPQQQSQQSAHPQAPKKTKAKAKGLVVTIPVGPSFFETDDAGRTTINKPVWRKQPKIEGVKQHNVLPNKEAPVRSFDGGADKPGRRVSFDPLVQQRLISPLPVKSRHSLPAAGAASSHASTSSQSLLHGAVPASMFALRPMMSSSNSSLPWLSAEAMPSRHSDAGAGLRLNGVPVPSWLTDSSSACGPRPRPRPPSRGWGISSP